MEAKNSLEQLFKALDKKDMKKLNSFLPESGPLAAVMCDGTILDSTEDYLDFHNEWFEDDQWSMGHDVVMVEETSEMAYAVAEGEYFDKDEDGEPYTLSLISTAVMRKVEGKWVLTMFQQTETQLDD